MFLDELKFKVATHLGNGYLGTKDISDRYTFISKHYDIFRITVLDGTRDELVNVFERFFIEYEQLFVKQIIIRAATIPLNPFKAFGALSSATMRSATEPIQISMLLRSSFMNTDYSIEDILDMLGKVKVKLQGNTFRIINNDNLLLSTEQILDKVMDILRKKGSFTHD